MIPALKQSEVRRRLKRERAILRGQVRNLLIFDWFKLVFVLICWKPNLRWNRTTYLPLEFHGTYKTESCLFTVWYVYVDHHHGGDNKVVPFSEIVVYNLAFLHQAMHFHKL